VGAVDVIIEVEEIIVVTTDEEESEDDGILRDINTGQPLSKVTSNERLHKKKNTSIIGKRHQSNEDESGLKSSAHKRRTNRHKSKNPLSPNISDRTLSPPQSV
jgi:hypothetical protein